MTQSPKSTSRAAQLEHQGRTGTQPPPAGQARTVVDAASSILSIVHQERTARAAGEDAEQLSFAFE